MDRSTIFAGFGGQGILFAGTTLARAAMSEGFEVFWIPSYGPEMRGGTASCTVIVDDQPVGSPVVDHADAIVVLNPPSLTKFESLVAPGGILVVNTSLIQLLPSRSDIEVVALPCTELASAAGDDRLVSIVALGALLARREIVPLAAAREALAALLESKGSTALLEADLAALQAGYAAAREVVAVPLEREVVAVPD